MMAGRRARLVELHRPAEDDAAESLLDAGRATNTVAELERLVADDPAREVRWSLLVRALVAADRRPEALRAYAQDRPDAGRRARDHAGCRAGQRPTAPRLADDVREHRDARPTTADDPIVAIDRLLVATGAAMWHAGDSHGATTTFLDAARIARRVGDVRRFAEAALGASGRGSASRSTPPRR